MGVGTTPASIISLLESLVMKKWEGESWLRQSKNWAVHRAFGVVCIAGFLGEHWGQKSLNFKRRKILSQLEHMKGEGLHGYRSDKDRAGKSGI